MQLFPMSKRQDFWSVGNVFMLEANAKNKEENEQRAKEWE